MHASHCLWIALLCVGCGAADGREPSPGLPDSSTTTAPADAALARLVTRCEASCPPDEHLALAQHLIERARDRRVRAFEAEERADGERDPAAMQAAHEETESAGRDAARDRQRAIAMLRIVAEDVTVPPSRVVETALFELLSALDDASEHDEVQRIAERIVRDAPTRPVAAHAWLAIGERAFEDAAVDRARDAYLAAAAVPGGDPQIIVYATYKLGWAYFNLSEFRLACDAFRSVAAASTQPLIAREARRDFVRALVPIGGSAAQDVAEVRGIASDDAQAAELARRYEQALRDVGLDPRADAFRAAWR